MTKRMMNAMFEEELTGFPGITQVYTEEYDENGSVKSVAHSRCSAKKGTEFVGGCEDEMMTAQCDDQYVWQPSLIKNDAGEWMIYHCVNGADLTVVPVTQENAMKHGISFEMIEAAGCLPEVVKDIRATMKRLPDLLAKKGAFAITDSQGLGTVVVVGKKIVRLGCADGINVLKKLEFINEDGAFIPGKKLTKKIMRDLDDQVSYGVYAALVDAVKAS